MNYTAIYLMYMFALAMLIDEPMIEYEATAYTARCDGCTGITKSGVDVRQTIHHEGKRVVAVDPRLIPLGTELEIRLEDGTTIDAIALDIGGAIKGRRIDILHRSKKEAYAFGRQKIWVRVRKDV